MILTVTPNSALDRILFLEEFRPGTTMRPEKMLESVGGSGLDVSVVLQTLKAQNIAMGFAAGPTGQRLADLLESYGIVHDLAWVGGETRTAHVLVETDHYRHSHIIAGALLVSIDAYYAFLDRYQAHLNHATWVVAGGSLPVGVPVSCYRHLTEMARKADVPILIDSFGPPMLEVLPAYPNVLKMNQYEFAESFELHPDTLDGLIVTVKSVRMQMQLPALVVTCGADGIIACTRKACYFATVPAQQAINAAGAGDGVSAALAWRLSLGDSWPDALRWAVATGAAVVLTEGTADCSLGDIEWLMGQAKVRVV